MNSTAQSLASTPLLSSDKTHSKNSVSGLDSPTGSVDKSIKNKEFSGVLDDQKELVKQPEKSHDSQSSEPLETAAEGVDDEQQLAGQGGNSLPVDALLPATLFPQTADLAGAGQVATNLLAASVQSSDSAQLSSLGGISLQTGSFKTASSGLTHTTVDGSSVLTEQSQANSVQQASMFNSTNTVAVDSTNQNTFDYWSSNNMGINITAQGQAGSAQKAGGITGQLSKVDVLSAVSVESLAGEEGLLGSSVPHSQGLIQASGSASANSPVNEMTATVNVSKPGWGEAVMQRVMWMSSQNISKAEIALDPPELGSLQVKISTHADQTSVVFSSQHGAVRDTLDQGLHRLREMMESQGLDLVDVDVSDQTDYQQQTESEHNADDGKNDTGLVNSNISDDESLAGESELTESRVSLVDQYV